MKAQRPPPGTRVRHRKDGRRGTVVEWRVFGPRLGEQAVVDFDDVGFGLIREHIGPRPESVVERDDDD
jgi:hypothetical protein